MYGLIRTVLYIGGGLGVLYAIINLFGRPMQSLIGIAVAAVLFLISRYVQPPEAEEAPPPDIDMSTDYRKEMVKIRKEARKAMLEGDKGESGAQEKGSDGQEANEESSDKQNS